MFSNILRNILNSFYEKEKYLIHRMEDLLPRSISVISGTVISLGQIGASIPFLALLFKEKIQKKLGKTCCERRTPTCSSQKQLHLTIKFIMN